MPWRGAKLVEEDHADLPNAAMTPTQHPQHQYGTPGGQGGGYPPHSYDTTGQSAPPGAHPRVTATLWEDEGSLCFQVEAKGVCVARREGTSLC